MKKSLIAVALAASFAAPAFAEEAAAPAGPHTLTANVGVFSSYRFRGIDQTFGKPALQGGIDYSHSSGFYAGNWNSNVNSGAGYPEGNLEMDFYGGYKMAFGDFGIDVGGLYYYYPGSDASILGAFNAKHPGDTAHGKVHNGELYIAGSWKFLSLKYSYAVTDYFNAPGTDGSGYLDLSANYDLGNGWGVNGHVGHLYMKDFRWVNLNGSTYDGSYTDWKVGVTKDFSGWVVGVSYVGTDAKGKCGNGEFYCFANSLNSSGIGGKTRDAGRGVGVLSVSRTF